MENLRFCTLTGVDEHTDLKRLARLSRAYPFSEWGVLFSRSRMAEEDGRGRYPRMEWIEKFIEQAEKSKIRCALHVCGSDALDFIRGDMTIGPLAERFGRVQINVKADGLNLAKDLDHNALERFIQMFKMGEGGGKIILQYSKSNKALCQVLRSTMGIEFLVDSSGGNGKSPDAWPMLREFPGQRFGFAGGLGPENVAEELERIGIASCEKPYWIDMEGKLRSAEDRFDLDACESVLDQTTQFVFDKLVARCNELTANGRHSPSTVEELDGLWLDWWSGISTGYTMAMPPVRAVRAMSFSRREGIYNGYQPSEYANDLKDALEGSDAGCRKDRATGLWVGQTPDGDEVKAPTRELAMLKATLVERLGRDLPTNPALHEDVISHWLGPKGLEKLEKHLNPHSQVTKTKKAAKP